MSETLSDRLKSWALAGWDWLVDRPKLVEVVSEAPNQAISDRAASSLAKTVGYVSKTFSPVLIPIAVAGAAVLAFYYLKGRASR